MDCPTLLRSGPLYLLAAALPLSIAASSLAAGLVMLAALSVVARAGCDAAWPPRSVLVSGGALVLTYLVATAAAPAGHHNWYKFAEELWIKLLLPAVPLLLVGRERLVPRLLAVLWVSSALAGVYGIVQHFHGWDFVRGESLMSEWGHHGARSFMNHRISWGGHLLVVILLLAARLLAAPWRRRQLLVIAALMVQGLALFWSYARGALIATVAGLSTNILLLRGRRRLVGAAVLTLPVLMALALPEVRLHLERLTWWQRHDTRLNLLESSWHGIQARPLTGWGPGNFDLMMAAHEVEGYYENRAHSHNDLVMHAVNAGVPGALAATALLVTVSLVLWRRWRWGGEAAWVALGALAVQVGVTVGGLFQVYQTDDEVEMLLYFVLGCALAVSGRDCQGEDRVRH